MNFTCHNKVKSYYLVGEAIDQTTLNEMIFDKIIRFIDYVKYIVEVSHYDDKRRSWEIYGKLNHLVERHCQSYFQRYCSCPNRREDYYAPSFQNK